MTKLTLIAARCRELLALAEKRTPGTWTAFQAAGSICVGDTRDVTCIEDLEKGMHLEILSENAEPNAAYIAACAGSAEAGWRSTLAAIEALECVALWYPSGNPKNDEAEALNQILAAWPDDIL